MKLTDRQITLLSECCRYNISQSCGSYYRLGGHGCIQIRWNYNTLPNLEKMKLVEYVGYYRATEAGKAFIAGLKSALA